MKKSTKISSINFRHWFLGFNDGVNQVNDGKKYEVSETQSILL